MLNVGNVYAQTVVLNPNPVPSGTSVTATGSAFPAGDTGAITLYQVNTGACSGLVFGPVLPFTVNGAGGFVVSGISTTGLSVGSHCVAVGYTNGVTPSALFLALTVTAAPPIPEYPLGLPLLAILTILAYTVIRRRTRN